mmetsp:Transcript_73130/g.158680  ORF Transcript_73130/g.158680 Transcript_73130/m.158680 type:complete len:220 (+) Transcript_73130:161-820(+)
MQGTLGSRPSSQLDASASSTIKDAAARRSTSRSSSAKVLQRSIGGTTLKEAMLRPFAERESPGDAEEPQAEPAPCATPVAMGQRRRRTVSAPFSSLPLESAAARALADRDVERARQQLCDGAIEGPMPTWVWEKHQEKRANRPIGGRHTSALIRPDKKKAAEHRAASAGRSRPLSHAGASGLGADDVLRPGSAGSSAPTLPAVPGRYERGCAGSCVAAR